MVLETLTEPKNHWKVKGWGRIILVYGLLHVGLAVLVYGIGLLLKRIAAERESAGEA